MFERFTDRARRVLVLAQDEARSMNHDFLGTEHLLLALLREGEGLAAKVLGELGVTTQAVEDRVKALIPPGTMTGESSGAPPFTPRAKSVMEHALREALQLGHNYIGTEHLLLGLLREGSGVAAQVLGELAVKQDDVRARVIEKLAGFAASQPASPIVAQQAQSTQGARDLIGKARTIGSADKGPIGTHHYLLAMTELADSMAGRILASLGVTTDLVKEKLAELPLAGTTDEDLLRTPITVEDGVKVIVDNLDLAERIRKGEVEIVVREKGQEQS